MDILPITVNASQFKARAGDYLDQTQQKVVFITKHQKNRAVLINPAYYQALKEQALKSYAKEMLKQAKKNKLSEEEILKLVFEAEQWIKK